MENLKEINFKSEQKLFHPIVSWIIVVVLVYLFYRTILQLYYNIPLGNSPMSNAGLLLFYFLLLILFVFLIRLKLVLIINTESIQIHFSPFFKKRIVLESINNLELTNYKAFGSGIRVSMIYGTIIRVKGEKGLHINSKYNNYLIGIRDVDVPLLEEIVCQINIKKKSE